ncbi:hypothetical protein KAR91_61425, partial [Candidatus Pacearchaeota archaeon]|nr:hypothetical protein [Candidatus Pacearchaeota archaeon]
MSNTLPNITIPKDVWLDVHAELSFTANVSVTIQNIGKSDLYYSISAVDPTSANTAYQILKRGQFYTSLPGGQKLWVFSAQQGNKINAEETDKRSATIVIGDLAGRSAMASIPGELHTAFKIDDISVNFQYGISTHDIVNGGNTTGTGVVGTFKAMATVSTGSGVGAAELISRSAIRYKAGNECQGALSHIFATPEVNVNQFCGLMNNDDGFTFGYKDLAFGVYFIEGGNNPIFTAQADFNRDKLDGTGASGYDINPQTDQVFRVSYTWHGMLPALFEVWGGLDRGWILCHSMEFTNSATET